ncbi:MULTISPECIES: hypothetical protein [Streptomyces]|uniref:Uncharacterized protein n=1 Tax=Streptomyces dengpaensis TaxID=2049881 RepID=A0ABM6SJI9_9ACTN|nr:MULTISPECIES: hypothetical protein [Streptomyces]AVH54813.1 hypothetical protein C4B68_02235 [Streptomyces dengpaensis]
MSLLPLLAACGTASHSADGGESSAGGGKSSAGSSGQLDVPADAGADLKKQYLLENAIAACMKKQGFIYTPVAPEDPEASWATNGADYKLTKKYREKYGFGVYAGIVYPNDPRALGSGAAQENSADAANGNYVAALTSEQRAAYDKAMGVPGREAKAGGKWPDGCLRSAQEEVYGSASAQEQGAQAKAQDQANAQALNGDPELVALAQSYASCLRDHGISVTTTQPTGIGDMVKFQASSSAPPGSSLGDVNADGTPAKTMSKDEALPLLTKDIGQAIKDLECGREFRAAYFPKFFKAPTSGSGGVG